MKHFSHLNTAVRILDSYKGTQPFSIFIKDFFRSEKKYGSKDRKQIGHFCYCFFRLGKAVPDLPTEERTVLGIFLCSTAPNDALQQLRPGWNKQASLPVKEKIAATGHSFSLEEIFPYKEQVSDGINLEELAIAHLKQPDLFLRLRPGQGERVEQKLQQAGIIYEKITTDCLQLSNGSKIEDIVQLNKEVVVQDLGSQRVGAFLQSIKEEINTKQELNVWDCCAASGGKSIMAKDILGNIDLTVTDIRESILVNLRHRFEEAGIKKYQSLVADLSAETSLPVHIKNYGLLIADLPCSGSGTWGRTPEQLYYFQEKKIAEYASLQKKILLSVIPAITKGGYLLYITCSVFRQENEAQVDFIQTRFPLQLKKMEVLPGYNEKADTLFAALFQRPL